MTQLIIYSPTGTHEVEVAEGQNVRDALDTTEW
jgi:hypothetical protein